MPRGIEGGEGETTREVRREGECACGNEGKETEGKGGGKGREQERERMSDRTEQRDKGGPRVCTRERRGENRKKIPVSHHFQHAHTHTA